ncbi:transposase family protein [Glycomyces tenuis]|uniref:transposase family protein n=1 Tax=Glycomyces tenuis TaxID=58116 RepID=UPI003D159B02
MVVTPDKGKGKPEYQKAHNRLHARLRGAGERAFAELKKWRLLRKLRCDPHQATQIARAIATLDQQERQSG